MPKTIGVLSGADGDVYPLIKPALPQKVSYTATHAVSSALSSTCQIVRVFSTTDCWIAFGTAPVAVAADGAAFFNPGGIFIFYAVTAGHKISAIRSATSGDLHITEAASQ